jgi:DnaJ homolog subfamily C member 3
MNRHPNAISDFDQVINLTSNSFDKAHLMKARIYAKDGLWAEARDSLKLYVSKVKDDTTAKDLLGSITEGEMATKKTRQAHRAKLWTACEEASSAALSIASHSIEIRQQRAECSLAAGDLEMAVGDLT